MDQMEQLHDVPQTLKHEHLIFAYGTLKRNHYNERVLQMNASRFVAEGVTVGRRFIMKDGGFPKVWFPPKEFTRSDRGKSARSWRNIVRDHLGPVKGELWLVSDEGLAACDHLEGHPTFYRRRQVLVSFCGTTVRAWMYLIADPLRSEQVWGDYPTWVKPSGEQRILEWH